jgi:hypothetical protein
MMYRVKRVTVALAGTYLSALGALLMVAVGAGAVEPSQFCRDRVVHDYEKPLRSLPKLRAIPEHPSFAPSNTSLKRFSGPRDGGSVVVLKAGEQALVKYGFSATQGSDRKFSLHWTIIGRAVQVNFRGDVRRPLAHVERRVGVVGETAFNDISLGFTLPSDTGLYRVDLVFRGKDHKILGRYGEYFRVVRPKLSVRLAVNPLIAHPGQGISMRLLNFGTEPIGYGLPFLVEQFDGTGWTNYPLGFGWHLPLLRLSAGQAAPCQTFGVPEDMPPGLYRFKKILVEPPRGFTAEFEVAP